MALMMRFQPKWPGDLQNHVRVRSKLRFGLMGMPPRPTHAHGQRRTLVEIGRHGARASQALVDSADARIAENSRIDQHAPAELRQVSRVDGESLVLDRRTP